MKIKIIWDFRGEGEAVETAKHHAIHIKEFCVKESVPYLEINSEIISNAYAMAYVIVEKQNVNIIRDNLKPHRAGIIEE